MKEDDVYLGHRDFEENPYSKDEMRVVEWINTYCGLGGGDDPIGFLIASYEYLQEERKNGKS